MVARSEALPVDARQPQLTATQFSGPGLVCGIGFALELKPDERLVRFDRMMDFVTYELSGPGREALIYEGNAPDAPNLTVETGMQFPSLVAIHLDAGGYDKSLARRIVTKDEIPQACAATKSE